MIYKYICSILLCGISFAQECKLKGTISDENGISITDASVSIFDSKNEGKGFVFTSNVGEFEFKLPCGDKYDIEIEQPGFEPLTENVDLTENVNKKIKLKKGSQISLQETIVKAQQAIKVKGDTIEYDADSFKIGNEETLEDILKKLPGIEVVNGKVMYKGKPMSQVTVGGREVLGGNEKLLNKNLPSDAVSKIQLNTKFKSNPFASSLQEDDEQFALNIELKENMKRLAFGNITLGGDTEKHTDAQAKIFYFSEKTDATLINDFNTFGKQVFDQDDYVSFFGGYSEFTSDGSVLSLRGGTNNFMFPSEATYPDMNTYNGAVHFGVEPNKRLKISGFGLINTNNISYDSKEEQLWPNYTIVNEEKNNNNRLMGMSRIRIDYNPNDKGQIKYRLNFNYLGNDNEKLINRTQDGEDINSSRYYTGRKNYSLAQTLSYIRKVGRDHNIGFYLRHQYQNENPEYNIFSNTMPFTAFGNLTQINNLYNLNQDQKYNVNTIQLYSVFNYLLTNTSNLKLKAGTNFSMQDFDNTISNYQTVLRIPKAETNTAFDYNETFFDATLTKKLGNFQVDLGAGVSLFNEQAKFYDGSRISFDLTKILPHINLQYKFNNATSIYSSYSQNYSLPHAKDLSDSYVLQSYYSIFEGNKELRQALTHSANINFNHFNSFNFFQFFTGVSYSRREKSILTSSFMNIENQTQINTLLNSDFEDETYSANISIGKRFAKWYNAKLSGNLSYSDYYSYLNNNTSNTLENYNNSSVSQNYTLTNTFTFKKKFELKAGLNLNLNNYESEIINSTNTANNRTQKSENWRPFAEAAYSITDKLLLQSDFSYRLQYIDNVKRNEAKELNASVRYNIARKTYLSVTGGNLLGNNVILTNGFNNNYISTTTRNVLGRYFIVSLKYKF